MVVVVPDDLSAFETSLDVQKLDDVLCSLSEHLLDRAVPVGRRCIRRTT